MRFLQQMVKALDQHPEHKFDPDWKVWIDGTPAKVLRADYLFQGLEIPQGTHEVELKYSPENQLLRLQFAGMAICAVAVMMLIFKRNKTVR